MQAGTFCWHVTVFIRKLLTIYVGARVVADGVAYTPHRVVDVRRFDVDFYVFSLYKLYGPHLAGDRYCVKLLLMEIYRHVWKA